jgi:CrcB protein
MGVAAHDTGGLMRLLLVCLGGALGSGARYLISTSLPNGTLIVNLLGSFAIAAVIALMPPTDVRLMIVTGVLGGFTTYSAFNEQTLEMLRTGGWGSAAVNVSVTVIGCLAAGWAGVWVAKMVR